MDPIGKGATVEEILSFIGESGGGGHKEPLTPTILAEILGGDLDAVEHLFPEEYWEAIESNDDDARDEIRNTFVRENPDAIFQAISEDNFYERKRRTPALPKKR